LENSELDSAELGLYNQAMKPLFYLACLFFITGCAHVSNIDPMTVKKLRMGIPSYDPCIRCGEQWQQLPNWEHEAIIRHQRMIRETDNGRRL